MSGSRLLVAALLLTGCNEYYARDNCHDPASPCEEGKTCIKGRCVSLDGGTDLDILMADLLPDVTTDIAKTDAFSADMEPHCVHSNVTKNCSSDGWCTIPNGCFLMGGPEAADKFEVTLTHDFEISQTEVTRGQFESTMGYNKACHGPIGEGHCSGLKGKCSSSSCPVENVTWHEAAKYCNKLSAAKGLAKCYTCGTSCQNAQTFAGNKIYDCPGYRLPTEAEWEYAYRAGSHELFYNGPPADPTLMKKCDPKDNNVAYIAWYCGNTSRVVQPTGGKAPNAWGLKDMAGNVQEWCHDWHVGQLSKNSATDPVVTNATSQERVYRGGAATHFPVNATAHYHLGRAPSDHAGDQGFRCVRSIIP